MLEKARLGTMMISGPSSKFVKGAGDDKIVKYKKVQFGSLVIFTF